MRLLEPLVFGILYSVVALEGFQHHSPIPPATKQARDHTALQRQPPAHEPVAYAAQNGYSLETDEDGSYRIGSKAEDGYESLYFEASPTPPSVSNETHHWTTTAPKIESLKPRHTRSSESSEEASHRQRTHTEIEDVEGSGYNDPQPKINISPGNLQKTSFHQNSFIPMGRQPASTGRTATMESLSIVKSAHAPSKWMTLKHPLGCEELKEHYHRYQSFGAEEGIVEKSEKENSVKGEVNPKAAVPKFTRPVPTPSAQIVVSAAAGVEPIAIGYEPDMSNLNIQTPTSPLPISTPGTVVMPIISTIVQSKSTETSTHSVFEATQAPLIEFETSAIEIPYNQPEADDTIFGGANPEAPNLFAIEPFGNRPNEGKPTPESGGDVNSADAWDGDANGYDAGKINRRSPAQNENVFTAFSIHDYSLGRKFPLNGLPRSEFMGLRKNPSPPPLATTTIAAVTNQLNNLENEWSAPAIYLRDSSGKSRRGLHKGRGMWNSRRRLRKNAVTRKMITRKVILDRIVRSLIQDLKRVKSTGRTHIRKTKTRKNRLVEN